MLSKRQFEERKFVVLDKNMRIKERLRVSERYR